MTHKKTKTPTGGNRGVLGNVNRRAADDFPNTIPSLADVQANFVSRRTRLSPDHARTVAALAFREVAA